MMNNNSGKPIKKEAWQYAYPAFRFCVQLNGGNGMIAASFTECSGLEVEVETHPYEEGGINDFVHKLPGRVKYADLVLRYGTCESEKLWDWFVQICRGEIQRRNISVLMYDFDREEAVRRWDFAGAYPVKWVGPSLQVDSNSIAVESLTFAHRGFVAYR